MKHNETKLQKYENKILKLKRISFIKLLKFLKEFFKFEI